jgi:hypothetical protein
MEKRKACIAGQCTRHGRARPRSGCQCPLSGCKCPLPRCKCVLSRRACPHSDSRSPDPRGQCLVPARVRILPHVLRPQPVSVRPLPAGRWTETERQRTQTGSAGPQSTGGSIEYVRGETESCRVSTRSDGQRTESGGQRMQTTRQRGRTTRQCTLARRASTDPSCVCPQPTTPATRNARAARGYVGGPELAALGAGSFGSGGTQASPPDPLSPSGEGEPRGSSRTRRGGWMVIHRAFDALDDACRALNLLGAVTVTGVGIEPTTGAYSSFCPDPNAARSRAWANMRSAKSRRSCSSAICAA